MNTQATVGNGQRQITPSTGEVKPERQRKNRTPKSMIPKIAPEMAAATKEVLKESDLDVAELVAAVVTSKASMGQSFSGRKAGQPIKAAVAAVAKRKLGIDPEKHVSDRLWKLIETETQKFLDAKLDEAVKDYPEVVSVRLNVPTIKVDADTKTCSDFLWQSRVARARKAKDYGDQLVGVNELLRAAKKRLNSMLGFDESGKPKNTPKAYTREEIDAQKARVDTLEKHTASLRREIAKLTGNGHKGKAKGKKA